MANPETKHATEPVVMDGSAWVPRPMARSPRPNDARGTMNFETSKRPWWSQATRSLRGIPADLVAAVGLLVVTNLVVLLPGLRDAPIGGASVRTLLGLPVLLFLPGYVLVSMLFPRRAHDRSRANDALDGSIDRVERIALSFGMSLAVLPMVGFVLATWWTITPSSLVTSLSVVLLAGIGVAAIRRLRLPRAERFGTSIGRLSSTIGRALRGSTGVDASTLVLVVAVVLGLGSIGFAVATPYQSGQSSTFYLLSENESGAELASTYPANFTLGESETLTVGIENDEERPLEYTVVVALERVERDGSAVRVVENVEVTRLHPAVESGASWTGRHAVAPELVGENLRLHYYLYKGDSAPEAPDPSSAYRDVYIWIDVNPV